MNNNRGMTLITTLCFMLIFTMLGLASIHISGASNDWANKQIASDEAFWLADGAIERSRSELPGTMLTLSDTQLDPVNYPNHTYNVSTQKETCGAGLCTHSWIANATGRVNKSTSNDRTRRIEAVISRFAIDKPFYTRGIVRPQGTGNSNYACAETPCKMEHAVISFETIFNGITYSQIRSIATIVTFNGGSQTVTPSPVTVVDVTTGNSLRISENLNTDPSFLVFDLTNTSQGSPTINVNNCNVGGNSDCEFWGVIWIIPKPGQSTVISIANNLKIHGTVFVAGNVNGTDEAVVNGTSDYLFDAATVDNAVDNLFDAGIPLTDPAIVSWKELSAI